MSILENILDYQRSEVRQRKAAVSLSELTAMPMFSLPRRSLEQALRSFHIAIIAEIKKASPSKGIIRENFDAVNIAEQFVENGAAALSVLTNEKYFQGKLEYIRQIRNAVSVPILRKEFIIDSYQLHEAKAYGADAVLLIASALTKKELHQLAGQARSLGLECLVEIHIRDEVDMLDFETMNIIGINNRDLNSFSTDVRTSITLRQHIPDHVLCVSESGIRSGADLELLRSNGFDAFLIGESLMRAEHPGDALRGLLASVRKEPGA
jgi:indole-3-glycerol phosphate synthase